MRIPDIKTIFSSPRNYTIFISLLSLAAIPGTILVGLLFDRVFEYLFRLWPSLPSLHIVNLVLVAGLVFGIGLAFLPIIRSVTLLGAPRISPWLWIVVVACLLILLPFDMYYGGKGSSTMAVWFYLSFFALHDLIFHPFFDAPNSISPHEFGKKIMLSVLGWALVCFGIMSLDA